MHVLIDALSCYHIWDVIVGERSASRFDASRVSTLDVAFAFPLRSDMYSTFALESFTIKWSLYNDIPSQFSIQMSQRKETTGTIDIFVGTRFSL